MTVKTFTLQGYSSKTETSVVFIHILNKVSFFCFHVHFSHFVFKYVYIVFIISFILLHQAKLN